MTGSYVRNDLVVSPCACGSVLVAAHKNDDELRNAVAYHAATDPTHRRWRLARLEAMEPAEVIGAALLSMGGRPIRVGLLLP